MCLDMAADFHVFTMLNPTWEFLPLGVEPAAALLGRSRGTLRASAHCSIDHCKFQMGEASVFGARQYCAPAKDHCA